MTGLARNDPSGGDARFGQCATAPKAAALLLVLALVAAPPAVGAKRRSPAGPARVCLVSVVDSTGRASVRRLRRTLERALKASPEFKLISVRKWARSARRRRIRRRRWLSKRTLRRVGRALKLDAVLVARVVRRRGRRLRYRLLLSARRIPSGKRLARRSVNLTRPAISRVDARHAVSMLSWRMTVASAPRPDPAVGPKATPRGAADQGSQLPSVADQPAAPARDTRPETAREDQRPAAPAEPATPAVAQLEKEVPADQKEWAAADKGWEPVESGPADAKAVTTASIAADGFPVKLGGRVTVEHFSYFEELGDDKVGGRNSVDFALQAEAKAHHVTALGRILFRHDFSNDRRDRLEAEEAYVDVELGPVTVRAGRVIVSWGTTNMVNATDVVNPVDMRDPLDPERLGSWMIRTGVLLGPVLIEGYYLPVPEAYTLPLATGYTAQGQPLGPWRWLGSGIPLPPGTPPLRVELDFGPPPGTSLANTQLGARVSTSFVGVDVALSYLWRFDPMPTIRITQTPDHPTAPTVIDVHSTFEFHRVHMIAIEGETTLGRFRLAAEALAALTEDFGDEDDAVPNPYLSAVAGVDYRSGTLFGDHHIHQLQDVCINMALVGTLGDDALARLRYPFDYAAFGRVRYEIGEPLRLDLNVMSSLDSYDLLLNPSVEWVLYDHFTLQLGGMILLGRRDKGFFGPFRDNARLELSAEVAF